MKNAPEDELRLVKKPSNPATASAPLNPATVICKVSVTEEPGLTILLVVGEKFRSTVPTTANAMVGSASTASTIKGNFFMVVFILGCLSVLWFFCVFVFGVLVGLRSALDC